MSSSAIIPPIQVGMVVHTRAIFPYPLPRGLSSGAKVVVTGVDEERCTVRDKAGREWPVGSVSLDPGQLVWEDGHWVPDVSYAA